MEMAKADRTAEGAPLQAGGNRSGEWLDLRGAASHLNKPERFIRRLVMERRIRYFKHGRYLAFRQSDLDEWALSDCRDPV
ncbi:MAG: helix-turn-helix domain-containing protein [Acidimicrobiales bacterium]